MYTCEYCGRNVTRRELEPMDGGSMACAYCCIDVECSRCGRPYVAPESTLGGGGYVCPECQNYSGWWSLKGVFVVIAILISAGLVWEYGEPEYLIGIVGIILLYSLLKYGVYLTILFATFPGVIIHEFAHKKSCDLLNIKVYDVSYFRFGNPLGYVQPEQIRSFWKTFAINTAPLLLNTVLAVILTLSSMSILVGFPVWVQWMGIWLAVSMGVHAFPSFMDLDNIWRGIKQDWRRNPTVILSIPFAFLLSMSHRFPYTDLIYGSSIVIVSYTFGLGLGLL